MKKIFSICALTCLCAVATQANTITGTVNGASNDTIFVKSTPISAVNTPQQNEASKKETVILNGNNFSFSDNASVPMLYEINSTRNKMGAQLTNLRNIELIMDANEKANVNINFNGDDLSYTVTASALNQELARQGMLLFPFQTQLIKLNKAYLAHEISDQEIRDKAMPLLHDMSNANIATIKSNLNQPASIYFLCKYESSDSIKKYAPILQKNCPKSIVSPVLKARLEQIKQRDEAMKQRQANAGNDNEGKMAPDFTLTDINGKPFKLSSLHGKFVILDFWGSWCGWCIKGMPALKDFYDKNKDKLQVVSVSCNDTKAAWKAAVAKHDMNWVNVFNPSDVPANKNVALKYAIEGYPTKYLIDPKGQIVVKVVGEDPDFYNKVEAAMSK